MARAALWEAMWRPSASRAMEPKTVPAVISTTIMTRVMAITVRVRRSPSFCLSWPKVWE